MRENFFENIGRETVTEVKYGLFGDVSVCRYRFMVGGIVYETEAVSLAECRKRCAEWLKNRSAAFSGHRKMQGNHTRIQFRLLSEIRACYASGYRLFYTGGAVGFDMLAAEAVLSEKQNCPDMVLVVAVPFNGQDAFFSQSAKLRYKKILEEADAAIILSESYYPKCYLRRYDFMLLHSSVLIAYWNGISCGGTSYTVRKALNGKRVVVRNLF
ncbi:SLOG family protein [uncultured Bacteroides sp.]|uniref:SLOG family protein n=1 Tax=uncultured Bacteroides sp. TaxID=162156 RepID=UPI00263A232E|nr:SLOG family protein [uncultured Bacteroides sp.]